MATKLFLAGALLLASLAPGTPMAYDGDWWAAQPAAQQASFAAGFQDCASTLPGNRLNGTQYSVAKYVTHFYQAHPEANHTSIAKVLLAGGPPPDKSQPRNNGDVYTGKHGYYLGEFWGELDGPQRAGFVEGSLLCEQAHGRKVDLTRAGEYALSVTNWFDADHGTSKRAIERADRPIAEALAQAEQAGPANTKP